MVFDDYIFYIYSIPIWVFIVVLCLYVFYIENKSNLWDPYSREILIVIWAFLTTLRIFGFILRVLYKICKFILQNLDISFNNFILTIIELCEGLQECLLVDCLPLFNRFRSFVNMFQNNRNNYQSATSLSAPPSVQSPIIPLPLKFETINSLEEQLEFYEIVSLVFLLYDNAHTALSKLLIAKITVKETGMQVGLISDWVRSVQDNNPKWQETLLEALVNVQCYAALKKLGFSKVEMNERFLPLNYECSINIHPVKKALYRLCEDLSKDVIEILVENVQRDLLKLNIVYDLPFSIENRYLEMHILYWITKRYIDIGYDNKNNLKGLLLILKQLNMKLMCTRLEMSVSRANNIHEELLASTFEKKLVFDKNREGSSDSMMSFCSYYDVEESKRYTMDPKKAGLVIIINQKKFNYGIEERFGTDFDRDRLREVWKIYGFKVIVHENLGSLDIREKIEKSIRNDFRDDDCCLVVVILSHGENGSIKDVDGHDVNIDMIANKMKNFQKLLGKPKILMIQACQGKEKAVAYSNKTIETNEKEICENLVTDSPSSKQESTAMINADFCQIKSTVPGFVSVRDTKKGSWLIQTFCDVLEKDGAKDHFDHLVLITKNIINRKRWGDTGMVPTVESNSLNKLLYFIPVKSY